MVSTKPDWSWESKTPLKFTEQQQLSRLQTEYDTGLKKANINDHISFKDEVWSYPLADKKSFKWPMVLKANYSYALSSMEPEKQNKIYQYGKSSQI
jgi:hypothetical protein